ncbi:MAG TPA: copper transporter [Gordonia polyisoprenivorans]|uniref:copper transporter n=1 Tax=Gordonia TaxID=2053 RepID=UPI000B99EB1D|nr:MULTISPECIES: copper transporter [Gordonia]MBE7194746.1 copper transporter [Gordonia polyisoprenivorans]OZC30763.1 channel protein [Gordonia polyisoprenivorans]UZF54016.1 copper transporter [Gordonia polyisoprenivorans]WCB39343.1 copper transporter [Gordonia polyisoprenivorans]WHU49199.1 copper transporter [Gordonia sp. L191]
MISLRQHAISLVAVFLALALGLFLGSGFVGDRVNSLTGTSRDRIGDLEQQRDGLNDQVNAANSFDAAIAPRLIADQLKGHAVLVVTTPNAADSDVDAVKQSLSTAGATFSGQLGLTDKLVRDDSAEQVRTIVDQTIPPGATLRAELTDSGSRVGDLLGTLVMHRSDQNAAAVADRQTGLQTLRDGGFLTYVDNAIRPADLVVFVSGDALPENSGAQGQLVARLAAAMTARAQGGELVGRSGSATGVSPIAVIRSDPALRNAITTIDNVDAQTGLITTVLALDEESQGRSGSFGSGPGATAITVGAQPAQSQPA